MTKNDDTAVCIRAYGTYDLRTATVGDAHMTEVILSTDSSPKWFTQVDLDGYGRTTEATLHVVPQLEFSDEQFTRVQFNEVDPRVTPSPTPDAT